MYINLEYSVSSEHAELFLRHAKRRIPLTEGENGLILRFCVNPAIGEPESYQIACEDGKWIVTGADSIGLYYGIGKLLHTARWSDTDFQPKPTAGVVTPACKYRALYLTVHFYNYYHLAPFDELEKYIEEIFLWGYNVLHCLLPVVTTKSTDEEMFRGALEQARAIYSIAKKLGIQTGLHIISNQGFLSAPHEFDNEPAYDLTFRGNLGRNICPAKPSALEYLKGIWRSELESFQDIGIDYLVIWPYDEGGCGCETCRPWGANGFCEICKEIYNEARKYYPDIKVIPATWTFDAPNNEGEYEGFYRRLRGDMSWVDMVMIDAHGDFPRYALEHEPIKPIVNFPEISMWGLYPWGGFGANPLPERFQRIWDSVKHLVKGGLPYSEGIYEDILKVQCIGYYWNTDCNYRDILSEYISYEYSAEVTDNVFELMGCIEENHTAIAEGRVPNLRTAARARELAEEIDGRLSERAKHAWRWRILYIRAVLDDKRYQKYEEYEKNPNPEKPFIMFSADYLVEDSEAQELFSELRGYYYCVEHNNMNGWTLPPLGGTSRSKLPC